jgi:hypothetical protein
MWQETNRALYRKTLYRKTMFRYPIREELERCQAANSSQGS